MDINEIPSSGERVVMTGGSGGPGGCWSCAYAGNFNMPAFEAPISTTAHLPYVSFTSAQTAFNPPFTVNDSMPRFEASRPLVTDAQPATTFNILPPGSTVQPDIVIGPNGVTMRPGLDQYSTAPAEINIQVQPGTTPLQVREAVTTLTNWYDNQFGDEDGANIRLVDPANRAGTQWVTAFNAEHYTPPEVPNPNPNPPNPNPNPEPDINPQPNNGGDTRPRPPGPHPPDPNDNNVNPNNDRVNPNDADAVVNPTDAAARTREFIRRFGDILMHGGGVHNKIIGKFWGKMIPQNIRNLMAALAANPDSPEALQALEGALTADNGATTHEIFDNLGREAERLRGIGDTTGADALNNFRTQLCGEDGRHPNMTMFQNLGNFLKKVQDGTASATDVQQMFPGTTANRNVVAAISHLALHDAAGPSLLNPTVPTNPAERATFMQNHRRAIEQLIMRLQTQPDQFPNLFGN